MGQQGMTQQGGMGGGHHHKDHHKRHEAEAAGEYISGTRTQLDQGRCSRLTDMTPWLHQLSYCTCVDVWLCCLGLACRRDALLTQV